MADRGLITCTSQPLAKANMASLASFVPQPANLGSVVGVKEVTTVQTPQFTTQPVNRGTPDAAGTLPVGGSGTKVTQFWG